MYHKLAEQEWARSVPDFRVTAGQLPNLRGLGSSWPASSSTHDLTQTLSPTQGWSSDSKSLASILSTLSFNLLKS